MKENESEGPTGVPEKAIAISLDVLAKSGLDVSDLPTAKEVPQGGEVVRRKEFARGPEAAPVEPVAEPQGPEVEKVSTSEEEPKEERRRTSDSINRKALEKTNRGVSPDSRRFIRGVLHPSPWRLRSAALFAIGVRVFSLLGVFLMGAVLLEKVGKEALIGLSVIPVFVIGYFMSAHKARCRVCGVKEFLPSGSRKHTKTHRFLGLGPIISTALHLLLFQWFYCMFCGTAVRIKK